MTWCEGNRVGYIFGLAGNQVLAAGVADLVEDAAVARALGEAEKVRRFGGFRASSASVFSPLTAAKATFALQVAVRFRRARRVMVPPDPRHPRRSRAGNPLIPLSKFPRPALCGRSCWPSAASQ
jgi:hypothetical protein